MGIFLTNLDLSFDTVYSYPIWASKYDILLLLLCAYHLPPAFFSLISRCYVICVIRSILEICVGDVHGVAARTSGSCIYWENVEEDR